MSVRGGSVRSEGNSVVRFEPVPRQVRGERDPDAAALLALVARDQQVPLPLLLHRSRCRARVAATRQLAMYLMNVVLGRSLTEVGEFFGRDRTTVSHACGLIEDRRDDAGFDAELDRLEAEIRVLVGEDDFGAEGSHPCRPLVAAPSVSCGPCCRISRLSLAPMAGSPPAAKARP